ncbi:hypothetical protein BJV82DRAFT_574504 [Fennellomyces sp. T-0311]|nr:hypothetical protein BJV82DRAFT_574504 [Fennellomyces sp. T-0311]
MSHGQFLDIVQGVSKLQNLHSLQLTTHGLVPVVSHDCICHWLQKCTRLVSIQLFGVCISAQRILHLCKLQSLEALILDMDPHEHCLQKGDLLKLANELVNSGVRTLQLSHMHGVTDLVVVRLARIKGLSALALLANSNVSELGVKAVIHQDAMDLTPQVAFKDHPYPQTDFRDRACNLVYVHMDVLDAVLRDAPKLRTLIVSAHSYDFINGFTLMNLPSLTL